MEIWLSEIVGKAYGAAFHLSIICGMFGGFSSVVWLYCLFLGEPGRKSPALIPMVALLAACALFGIAAVLMPSKEAVLAMAGGG